MSAVRPDTVRIDDKDKETVKAMKSSESAVVPNVNVHYDITNSHVVF